jgi:hypothetical protein
MANSRTVTSAGVIATGALVLIFGNQAVTEWIGRHTNASSPHGRFLRILAWPSWVLGPRDGSSAAMRDMLGQDLRALLLVVFVAILLSIVGKSISGGAGAFFLGWSVLIFASALAAFVTRFIMSDPTFVQALDAAAAASAYGLFAGWIVGIAASSAAK